MLGIHAVYLDYTSLVSVVDAMGSEDAISKANGNNKLNCNPPEPGAINIKLLLTNLINIHILF